MGQSYETVTIPTTSNPYRVIVNGVEYKYEAGATVEVPPEVAAAINASVNAASDLVKPGEVKPPFGASGDSGGGAFIVSLTQTGETDFSADKTFAEISAAIEAGQSVVLKVITGTISSFVPLHMYTSNIVAFQGIQFQPLDFSNPSVMDGMMVGMYQCDTNNVWQTGGEIYQLTIPK